MLAEEQSRQQRLRGQLAADPATATYAGDDVLFHAYKQLQFFDTFSLYLHMPTITDPSLAPEGHEAFYVLSPVPHLGADVDWDKAAKPYRDAIMQFLEDNYLPDLQENLVVEHMIDPIHFRDELNSEMGAAFSVQPVLTQSASPRSSSLVVPCAMRM